MVELYGHPFSAFTWKVLIALHERAVPFLFRRIDPDHPEHGRRIAELSPTGQFPALVDGGREVTGSNAVIHHLDVHHGASPPMVPAEPDAAIASRMMADLFDDYVAAPMQRIVADALRAETDRDPYGVAQAQGALDRTYAWLEPRIGRHEWAAGERFTIADCAAAPTLFYADWTRPIGAACPALAAYRRRLLARASVARVVEEARPYRAFFPLGAPDRD